MGSEGVRRVTSGHRHPQRIEWRSHACSWCSGAMLTRQTAFTLRHQSWRRHPHLRSSTRAVLVPHAFLATRSHVLSSSARLCLLLLLLLLHLTISLHLFPLLLGFAFSRFGVLRRRGDRLGILRPTDAVRGSVLACLLEVGLAIRGAECTPQLGDLLHAIFPPWMLLAQIGMR